MAYKCCVQIYFVESRYQTKLLKQSNEVDLLRYLTTLAIELVQEIGRRATVIIAGHQRNSFPVSTPVHCSAAGECEQAVHRFMCLTTVVNSSGLQ